MLLKSFGGAFALFFALPAIAQSPPPLPNGTMSPSDAVTAGAKDRDGKRGTFGMFVRSTGQSGGHVFLNSEVDYRDPRNLSIDIDMRATKLLRKQVGATPDQFYKDKWIVVRGTVRRVPIVFLDDRGRGTGKYYFQTHVFVREPGQIAIAPANP